LRSIVHLDADAFFASVEQASDPRLRGKPIAVGGEKRGIIASASYEARRFGVYTPMPTIRARRLCPKLIILPGDFEKYERFSRWMFSYAYDFTPDVEIASIDEGYFDLSGVRKPAVQIARTVREAIAQSLKISVSEGIASNKLVSQVASKLHKPAAFFQVGAGHEASFLQPLANRWLPGIGPKTAGRLNAAGLARIGQIARTPVELLGLLVGSMALGLNKFANGIDERPVVPASEPAKSYSQQQTFDQDQTDEPYLEAVLCQMADELMARVREERKAIRTVTVKVRYNDMAEDQCGESLWEPTDLETDLYGRLAVLLRRAWQRRVSLRMVSLKLSNIYDGIFRLELPLASARVQDDRRRLAAAVDEVRQRLGRNAVFRGHQFELRMADSELRSRPSSVVRGQMANGKSQMANGQWPMANRKFSVVPLNVRSYYSFLDSTLSIEAIVQWARQNEIPALALTDSSNLHGAAEFAQTARAAGLQPIIGAEIFLEGKPLRLYVENSTGYRNLCRILTDCQWSVVSGQWSLASPRSSVTGFPSPVGSPRNHGPRSTGRGLLTTGDGQIVNRQSLDGFTDGLVAASSDASFAALFPGRFYQTFDSAVAWRRSGSRLPAVLSWPVHYAVPDDRWKFDVVQSIRTLTLLRQTHPEKRLGGEFHFRSPAEIRSLSGNELHLLERTFEIAQRCAGFEFPFGQPQFPAFAPPDGSTPRQFLRQLVERGLRRRYGHGAASLKRQTEEELQIIAEVGYEEYFLVVWDILQECQRRGIAWITRGSAADSLVCYCLGISDVCPIRFDLYFRRFLNRERMRLNKLPDIDIDFPHDRKDDVIDLIFEKYGREHVAVVGGFSTYRARGAVGDVAKVLGVSEYHIRRFTERLPWAHARGLSEAIAQNVECRDLPMQEEPYRTALLMAEFLDGFPRYPKMHPCGVVLSRQPMDDLTPTFISNKGYPATHYDMDAVELIGLIKMDILAQGGLSVMRDVAEQLRSANCELRIPQPSPVRLTIDDDRLSLVGQSAGATDPGGHGLLHDAPAASPNLQSEISNRESPGPLPTSADGKWQMANGKSSIAHSQSASRKSQSAIPFNRQSSIVNPFDDSAVWEMIASGGARAVHHIESPAMIGLCRMCNVREIDGLIAIVSVIRPGAANEQKKVKFTRRYQGLEPVVYPDPSLEPCLKSTFGLVVYEEHILQICELFAGLPAGRADVLRRALGKQKLAVIAEIQREFFASARARGHREEKIVEVWELVSGFSGYAFCKAHSTAYGVEAYQSAWLKRYYPAEFMAAVLTNGKGFYHPLVYVLECHRLGLPLLPPSINAPGPAFAVENGKIRVPVTRVKGLTERTKKRLLDERTRGEFQSLADFYQRVNPLPEEMELLIRAGALDVFGKPRTAQFWEFQISTRAFPKDDHGQGWLLPPPSAERLPEMDEPPRRQRLEWEVELFGFPVSGHPLELHDDVAWETYCPVSALGRHIGEEVVTCGLIIEQRVHEQVTGEPMKFLTLADWTGMVETELFAATYRSYGLATVRYPVLEITATVEPFENGRGFSLRVHRAGKARKGERKAKG